MVVKVKNIQFTKVYWKAFEIMNMPSKHSSAWTMDLFADFLNFLSQCMNRPDYSGPLYVIRTLESHHSSMTLSMEIPKELINMSFYWILKHFNYKFNE